MEQNLVSDEELIERISKVLKEADQDRKKLVVQSRHEEVPGEKFHDVYETLQQEKSDCNLGEKKTFGEHKNLVLENHCLSLQLQAEKNKSRELQSKFKLFENSVKYFERLNGQLENIKRAVDEEYLEGEKGELGCEMDTMQKIRPKTIHTATSGVVGGEENNEGTNFSEPNTEENSKKVKEEKEEVVFRDAEDFKQLEQGLEIVKDKETDSISEAEKVFITKTEKRCLEDIGNLAARTRAPLDDKHQRYFERDRRKYANSITMPEIQEVDKSELVPPEIISKTKETPVNITSTELDGLRSYLLQLKELIARRETAWARTTERDYHQRVEITRFKNEVTHLRMLCEKRQKDIKEKDQIIAAKEDEIRELQKRVQGLRNAVMKLEKKDDRLMDTLDGVTNEVLENSHLVQKSYNAMKRQSMMNRSNVSSSINLSSPYKTPANVTQIPPKSKELGSRKAKIGGERSAMRKAKESTSNDDERSLSEKVKTKGSKDKPRTRHRSESLASKPKDGYDKVDEKLQRVEEMLHSEVLKNTRKTPQGRKAQSEIKSFLKNHVIDKNQNEIALKKLTPSNSTIRQEMLTAMTGLNQSSNYAYRTMGSYGDPKKNAPTAAVIANALLAARNNNLFN